MICGFLVLILVGTGFVYWNHTSIPFLKNEPNASNTKDSNPKMDDQLQNNETEKLAPQNTPGQSENVISSKDLHAQSALLMDASNYRVLYEKSGFKTMPMASTTKIMTLLIVLENANLEDIVTVSKYASTMPDVQLGIRKDEQYKLGDLVYSLMLESHNDTAVAIAEHVGGSVEGFASMMNAKAKELGCENTNFVTPNGLDADGHYTTAADLAKIASYAIQNKKFIEITNTSSWSFKELSKGRTFSVNNKNRFLGLMKGAIGIKTGFTGKAGFCFVGALKKNGKTFVSVVLACGWPPQKNYKWSDTTKLMNYGLDYYTYKTLYQGKNDLKTILVEDGIEKETNTYSEGYLKLLMNDNEKVEYLYETPDILKAPTKKGNTIGYVKILIDGTLYEKYPIKVSKTIPKIDYKYCFDRILNIFLLGS